MDMSLLKNTVHDLSVNGVHNIRLYSTAEPTLHPCFDDIIYHLKSQGMNITVSTNASQLMKHKESLGLVDTLQYSIEGWDRESYEFLRRPLKFGRIQAELSQFTDYLHTLDKRPKTSINLLLTKKTDIHGFLDMWGDFVDTVSVNFMMGVTRYTCGCFVTETPEELQGYLYPYTVDLKGGCMYPFDILTVAYDGKVALCCEDFVASLPFGVVQSGVKTVFHSEELQHIRHQYLRGVPEMCRGCNRFRRPLPGDVDKVRLEIDGLCHPYKNKMVLSL